MLHGVACKTKYTSVWPVINYVKYGMFTFNEFKNVNWICYDWYINGSVFLKDSGFLNSRMRGGPSCRWPGCNCATAPFTSLFKAAPSNLEPWRVRQKNLLMPSAVVFTQLSPEKRSRRGHDATPEPPKICMELVI